MDGTRIPLLLSVTVAALAALIGGPSGALAQGNLAPVPAVSERPGSTPQREDEEFSSAEYRLLTARIDDLVAQLGAQRRTIEAQERTLAARLTGPRVQSGVIFVPDRSANESGLSRAGNGDCRIHRVWESRLDFEQPFTSIPEVLVALTQVDLRTYGEAAILSMAVTGVDAGGFNYLAETWCAVEVARVRAEWIAVAR